MLQLFKPSAMLRNSNSSERPVLTRHLSALIERLLQSKRLQSKELLALKLNPLTMLCITKNLRRKLISECLLQVAGSVPLLVGGSHPPVSSTVSMPVSLSSSVTSIPGTKSLGAVTGEDQPDVDGDDPSPVLQV